MTLKIEDLHKSFGTNKALNGMSFTANTGQLFGFVGSNGAGKTTTMRIMLGVLNADSGKVTLNGKELTFADRKNFGYMPEERGLYPRMKILDQLVYLATLQGLDRKEAVARSKYWLERLNIASRAQELVQALSLGNQQRVQLAAALVHDPQFLVLDEPFSGLDPLAVETMTAILKERAQAGTTIIFSSHQLDLVERICDRVGICSQGSIVAQGTIDELRTTTDQQFSVQLPVELPSLQTALAPFETTVTEQGKHSFHLSLARTVNDQELLQSLLKLGPVHSFTPYRPHLTELFSNIVVSPPVTDEVNKPQKARGLAKLFGKKK